MLALIPVLTVCGTLGLASGGEYAAADLGVTDAERSTELASSGPLEGLALGETFDLVAARGPHVTPGEPQTLSKKQEWFRDKTFRPEVRVSDATLLAAQRNVEAATREAIRRRGRAPTGAAASSEDLFLPGTRLVPITTLFNIWTHEALPMMPGDSVASRIHTFLRDHYTNQETQMDTRLVDVLTRAARKFSAARIEVVSGYRSPKYNLMLRKKGHQVARASQHVEGHAVDFRIRGVPTRSLLHFVRSLRLGGVGFYPHSQFVHSDTGRVRYWTGS